MQMAVHEHEAFLVASARAGLSGCFPTCQLHEKPRVEQRSTANGDPRASGLMKHLNGVVQRAYVAVTDDRNALDGFHDGANAGEIHVAAETLLSCSAVDGQSSDADLLKSAGEIRRAPASVVPAQAHLDGHREFHGTDDALH